MRREELLPMNLQFFAEDGAENSSDESKAETEQTKEDSQSASQEESSDDKSLQEQLQSALVEIAKLKRSVDKASSEAAEFKKKYRESLTETEKASQEKAEAEAAKQAEFDEMKRKLAINDLINEYMDREFPKDIATKIATARYDGDNDTVNAIEKQMDEAKRKKWEADFLKSRPEIAAGAGTSSTNLTKEDFDKMSLVEKTKLKRENEAEYNRLKAL